MTGGEQPWKQTSGTLVARVSEFASLIPAPATRPLDVLYVGEFSDCADSEIWRGFAAEKVAAKLFPHFSYPIETLQHGGRMITKFRKIAAFRLP